MQAEEQIKAALLIAQLERVAFRIQYPLDGRDQDRWLAERERVRAELAALDPSGTGLRLHEFEKEVDRYIGRRVRIARQSKLRELADLGDAIGLNRRVLSRIEHGERSLRVAELLRIAIELRKPLPFFLEPCAPEVVTTGWEKST